MTTPVRTERNSAVTTAPARPILLGPNGQALNHPDSGPASGDWQPVRTADNAVVWERPRITAVPEPAVDEQAETDREKAAATLADAQLQADRIVEAAQVEADRVAAEARSLRARTLAAADHDAKSIRETAAATAKQEVENGKRLDVWMARAVIAGAVGLTATGEYSLARLAHFPREVAWLLPFVIDVYVIQAFRRHCDIVQAIGLTIAANVVYHLAAAGMFGVTTDSRGAHHATWWLIALVASIASVILWRMHVITAPPKVKEKRRKGSQPKPAEVAVQPVQNGTADVRESADQGVAGGTPNGTLSGMPTVPDKAPEVARQMAHSPATVAATSSAKVTAKVAVPSRHERATDSRRPVRRSGGQGGTEADRQVAKLVALMRRRGGADKVTAADAVTATGAPARTASRRLAAAREQYAKTTNE